MQPRTSPPSRIATIFIASLISATLIFIGQVHADKPEWAGKKDKSYDQSDDRNDDQREDGKYKKDKQKKKSKSEKYERYEDDRGAYRETRASASQYFTDQHRAVVQDYYVNHYHGKRCPPGLAKKNNGCMPPGQAKKWSVGRPIPPDVVYYAVPQPVVVLLGPAPRGQRYVQINSDLLLIALGTGLVVDAMIDFNW